MEVVFGQPTNMDDSDSQIDFDLNDIQNTAKRKSDAISPPISDARKRYTWSYETILSKNRYYLNEDNETAVNKEINKNGKNINSEQTPSTSKPKTNIPPIYIHDRVNYTEVINDIKNIATDKNFTTLTTTGYLRINLNNADDFRNLTKYYTENGIGFHTFQNPNEKPLQVVIRNVPESLTPDEIKNELLQLHFPVTSISRLYNKSKHPMPLCIVSLVNNEGGKAIFKLEKLLHSVVTVEARRKTNDIPQCFRCQRYGHTKNYCNLTPRCVKCLGSHLYKDCSKNVDEQPTCVNCHEHHPANYKGCLYYRELQAKQTAKLRFLSQSQRHTRNETSFVNQHYTYADKVKNSDNNKQQLPDTVSTILKHITDLITHYLPQIKTFIVENILPRFFNGP